MYGTGRVVVPAEWQCTCRTLHESEVRHTNASGWPWPPPGQLNGDWSNGGIWCVLDLGFAYAGERLSWRAGADE